MWYQNYCQTAKRKETEAVVMSHQWSFFSLSKFRPFSSQVEDRSRWRWLRLSGCNGSSRKSKSFNLSCTEVSEAQGLRLVTGAKSSMKCPVSSSEDEVWVTELLGCRCEVRATATWTVHLGNFQRSLSLSYPTLFALCSLCRNAVNRAVNVGASLAERTL